MGGRAPRRGPGAWRSAAPARLMLRPRACVLPGCPTSPTSAAARTPPRRTCAPGNHSVPDQRPAGFRAKVICQETRGEPGRVVRGVDEVWLVREPVMRAVDRAPTRLAPNCGCLHVGRVGGRGDAPAEERGARAGCAPSPQRESSRTVGKGTRAAEPFGPFLLPVNKTVIPLACRAAITAGRSCLQPALVLDIDGGLPNGFARLCVWHKRRENYSWDINF